MPIENCLLLQSPSLVPVCDCGAVLELQQLWPRLGIGPPSFWPVLETYDSLRKDHFHGLRLSFF